jgi:signal transduction histidine kinase
MGRTAALGGWLVAGCSFGLLLFVLRVRAVGMETVARVAHELRGPITAARLGLHAGELSAARLRAIDLELARAALALDDLQSVRRPWVAGEFDLTELLSDAVEASQAIAQARGVQVGFGLVAGPAYAFGDRVRIAQAIRNLIANAIEHGGGRVEVRLRHESHAVRIEVIDGGPGLPAPVAELVRRPRAGRGARGRGLAIASAIAAEHGGRLAAAPSERGARLVLELPAAAADVPADAR